MAYRLGPNGERIEYTSQELQQMYERYSGTNHEGLKEVTKTWEERLQLLRRGVKTEDIEIKEKDTLIYSAFSQDLNLFCQWMKSMIESNNNEFRRVYGYSIRQAENLGVARRATHRELEEILNWLRDQNGKKPLLFVIYREKHYVPGDLRDPVYRKAFYFLEGLRRKAIKDAKAPDTAGAF